MLTLLFTLTKIDQKASSVALGSGIGIILAVVLAYIIFKSSIKFNLKLIFKILGLVLIYIGAEMFAEGILKFITIEFVKKVHKIQIVYQLLSNILSSRK